MRNVPGSNQGWKIVIFRAPSMPSPIVPVIGQDVSDQMSDL